MSTEYYLVYSFKSRVGITGMGRTTITCREPIHSMARIEAVEAALLADHPELENLILLSWTKLE